MYVMTNCYDSIYLISLTMVEILVTDVWFLAKILALGEPSQVNQSPYCCANLATPLVLKIFS